MISGLLRVRNEELILEDTIKHFLQFCDEIYAYDDASTDRTREILLSFDKVKVTAGTEHQPQNESSHREKLLRQINSKWVLVFDADERLYGDFSWLKSKMVANDDIDGYTFQLFDAYMTKECDKPYTGGELAKLPRMYGPERRDIMMLFRPHKFAYVGRLQREPAMGSKKIERANMQVQHFGKALSLEHWHETCLYYSTWPEPYGSKWKARIGKAIHEKSDWGLPLYAWPEVLKYQVRNEH